MITIVIPSYNYARFLPEAVRSAIEQREDGLVLEVLVMDDGSTDETGAVAASFGGEINYLRQSNSGLSATRNAGMRAAAHDMVLFLDADDVLLPGAVKALWEAWRAAPEGLAVMAGREIVVDAFLQPKGPPPTPQTGAVQEIAARDLVIRSRFAPAVLADRRVLLGLGGFESGLRASEDRDMWIRVAARHQVAKLDKVTLWKRDHGGNMSRAARQQTECIRQVLARAAANPELRLAPADFRVAEAVCWYQSALMYAEAGELAEAQLRLLRSLIARPALFGQDAGIPFLTRLRAFASLSISRLKGAGR